MKRAVDRRGEAASWLPRPVGRCRGREWRRLGRVH